MSGQPGAGCDDPRDTHPHWCGFCGAKLLFAAVECRQLYVVPPCPRCGEKQWRGDINAAGRAAVEQAIKTRTDNEEKR